MGLLKKKKKKEEIVWKKAIVETFGGATISWHLPEAAVEDTFKEFAEYNHKMIMHDMSFDTKGDFVDSMMFVHNLREEYKTKLIRVDENISLPASGIRSVKIVDIPEGESVGGVWF